MFQVFSSAKLSYVNDLCMEGCLKLLFFLDFQNTDSELRLKISQTKQTSSFLCWQYHKFMLPITIKHRYSERILQRSYGSIVQLSVTANPKSLSKSNCQRNSRVLKTLYFIGTFIINSLTVRVWADVSWIPHFWCSDIPTHCLLTWTNNRMEHARLP